MKIVLTAKEIKLCLTKMVEKIIKSHKDLSNLVFIGVLTRGVYLAKRIIEEIRKKVKVEIPLAKLDITFYRDDVDSIAHQPQARETDIPFDLTDRYVILVDDVLFTGRSVRAALDEIIDFGRPKKIELAVLIDRGHRELPISAQYVGKVVKTCYSDKIQVYLKEIDKVDKVVLLRK